MSEVSDQIEASIILADFVNVDALGKANIVGAGLRVFGLDPNTKHTAPFGLMVFLSSPLSTGSDSPAFEILLTTATGQVVQLPGGGGNQALRISQNVDFVEPTAPGIVIPKGSLPSNVLFGINFGTGLPLSPGNSYQFRAQIDDDVVATYSFFVPRAASPAVIG
jgi:hypothetical protein